MKRNNSGFTPIIILLLVVVGIGIAGYVFKDKLTGLIKINLPQKVSLFASPTPIPDVTANWKIYISEKYGYSVKYPSDWGIVDVSGNTGDGVYIAPQINVNQINKMKMYPNNIGKNFVSLIDIAEGVSPPTSPGEFWKLTKTEDLAVGGIPVKRYILTNIKDTPNGIFFKGDIETEVLIPLKDNLILSYTLMDNQYALIFEQILSTFKFN